MGELHLDIYVERIRREYKVSLPVMIVFSILLVFWLEMIFLLIYVPPQLLP
jgi:translation elongation factor EF-4